MPPITTANGVMPLSEPMPSNYRWRGMIADLMKTKDLAINETWRAAKKVYLWRTPEHRARRKGRRQLGGCGVDAERPRRFHPRAALPRAPHRQWRSLMGDERRQESQQQAR